MEKVTFTDSAFEQYVRDLILKPSPSVIYTSDLWAVTEFVMPEEVTDFSDLHYFTGLHSLTIHNGMFDDYTFLMEMPYLEKLDLSGSLVSAQTLEYIGTLTRPVRSEPQRLRPFEHRGALRREGNGAPRPVR